MSNFQLYNVTITYTTDTGMLGRDGHKHPAETGTLKYNGLKSGEVHTLIRKHMAVCETTPMNSLRPFDVHVEPVGWKDLQKEAIMRRDEAVENIQRSQSNGAEPETK